MKKMFLILLCSLLLVSFAPPYSMNSDNDLEIDLLSQDNQGNQDIILSAEYSDYCDGWDDGYCEGWKDVKGEYAICPVTPICPIANPGQTRYKDGYNRGFKAGRAAAKR